VNTTASALTFKFESLLNKDLRMISMVLLDLIKNLSEC
jgi:hypothetical protein